MKRVSTAVINTGKTLISFPKWWVYIILAIIFFFGLVGRFYDLDDPPLDFHGTRQLHSMLMARDIYRASLTGEAAGSGDGQIEPPIMERLTALGYRLFGTEDLRIPRVLAISFWTFGAVGLFLLLKEVVGEQGAVFGLAYYMVLPYALYASRSFQPESLMTAAIIWAWWGMLKWHRHKTWKWAIIAGLLAGFAIYVKSPAVFFIAPAWLGLNLGSMGLGKALKNRQVWLLAFLSILPFAVYHIYGVFIAGFLSNQFGLRFYPELIKDPFHYLIWKDMIDRTLVLELFLIALLGILAIKKKPARVLFIFVWVGYLLYGTVFSYHIISHDYYQVPFVPAVAVGLAGAGAALLNALKGKRAFTYLVITSVLFFWMSINFWDARMHLKHNVYKTEPPFWQMLGKKLEDLSVMSMTADYGMRLTYWGEKGSTHWMSTYDFDVREMAGQEIDREALFLETVEGKDVFVITEFAQLDNQPNVKQMLYENFPILEQTDQYIIFDLRE